MCIRKLIKPKDGSLQGGYVILTITNNGSTANKDSIQCEQVRFDYDIEKAARAIEDRPLPHDYGSNLIKIFSHAQGYSGSAALCFLH